MSNFRNRSVNVHQFAMIPRADIPRSSFRIQHAHKTTVDAGYLVPIYVDEVVPGDSFNVRLSIFARMSTPVFPIMDNMYLETFFFFVPNRLVWGAWEKFCGEQTNPGDSTSYTIPYVASPLGGFPAGGFFDHLGIPVAGTANLDPAGETRVNALPCRAYNLILNEWFRDQNLENSYDVPTNDGPDSYLSYQIRTRGKRHDYFTSCLPWLQKGNSVPLPLGTSAPVIGDPSGDRQPIWATVGTGGLGRFKWNPEGPNLVSLEGAGPFDETNLQWSNPKLIADLSAATAATINQIRQSFQVQRLLERDARGGTRYTEIVRAHFGVLSPDARLQRPEYLGGGSTPIDIHSVAQTSGTAPADGYTPTPQGNVAAFGTAVGRGHGFRQSFTEHGYIIGLMNIRADLTYQQGLRRLWTRQTRYDFYWPVFAHLGEQAVLQSEIYHEGIPSRDDRVFGYQERWAEYRYNPSLITGKFRSGISGTLDAWHLSQYFTAAPTLSGQFIAENPPVERVIAAGAQAAGQEFLVDMFFDNKAARPMPMYSVPGLVDHF